eukprot:CAMPEP_0198212208 /NCGR_PEP_ID=MMETSP1445-20131203/25582_1 /TAXON_ID=36898 /ORGANISM="Pyramimonas sp., Strain CCMP2087" /LENGTH=254 /DNA_ID=CAMNT_0043886605 /DNA_START=78 /DNA_END=842 /DNA_ORIENTATION=-
MPVHTTMACATVGCTRSTQLSGVATRGSSCTAAHRPAVRSSRGHMLIAHAVKGFGNSQSRPVGTDELWLPQGTRESIMQRERLEMENEQNEKYTEDYMDHFGVKEEDKPGYTLGDNAVCPCRQGNDTKLSYEDCCMPHHEGRRAPEDPLALMRSRYSAYVKKLPDYLVQTTHTDNPDYKGGNLRTETESICKHVTFEQLIIISYENRGDEGFVTFEASMKGKRGIIGGALRETSRFVKEDGVWIYREAVSLDFL